MKVSKWSKKSLIPFWLLIYSVSGVRGEMTFNAKNLPTPWPIALIGILISIVGIFRFKKQRNSFNILTKLSLVYTIVRPLVILLESWASVATHGINNSNYPALSVLTSLSILPIWDSLYDWEKDRLYSENDSEETEQQEYELEEITNTDEGIISQNHNRVRISRYLTGKRFKVLRNFFLVFATINLLWFVSFAILSVNKNYSIFTTYCSQNLNGISALDQVCVAQGEGFSCVVYDKNMSDCYVGTFLLSFLMCVAIITDSCINKRRHRGKFCKGYVSGKKSVIVITAFSLFYLTWMTVSQARGLTISPTSSLAKYCDINYSLLSSNTGYIAEWWASKLNTARHIALL